MRIDDFRENADGGKWTFRWGNSELKMGENFNLCLSTKAKLHHNIRSLKNCKRVFKTTNNQSSK